MARSTNIASRLLLATALASAVVFSSTGAAAAATTAKRGCTSDGQVCDGVFGSGYTVQYSVVSIAVRNPSVGNVVWGYCLPNWTCYHTTTGPYHLTASSQTNIGPCYYPSGTFPPGTYIFAVWQRISGDNPGNGNAAAVYLPIP
jgi:hypothetical protein